VKNEANINNKRGGYFLTDSDSDSFEYRRQKNKPSVSFVDVKSETKNESQSSKLTELIASCLFCFVIFFSVVAEIGIVKGKDILRLIQTRIHSKRWMIVTIVIVTVIVRMNMNRILFVIIIDV
jgi:hypothetical protein